MNLYSTSSAPTRKEGGEESGVSVCLRAEGAGSKEGRRGYYKTQPKTNFTYSQNKLLCKALQLTWLLLKGNHDTAR